MTTLGGFYFGYRDGYFLECFDCLLFHWLLRMYGNLSFMGFLKHNLSTSVATIFGSGATSIGAAFTFADH